MPAGLTRDTIAAIAALANLDLDASEIDLFSRQLGDILAYAEIVQQIDTTGVPPTASLVSLPAADRPDERRPSLDARPEHACGGGPAVAVMRAAQLAGARDALILNYANSGDVSGDKSSVVGYLAAALGNFGAVS